MPEIVHAVEQELATCGLETNYVFNQATARYDCYHYKFATDGQFLIVSVHSHEPLPAWWFNWGSTNLCRIELNDPVALAEFLEQLTTNDTARLYRRIHGAKAPADSHRPIGAG